MNCKNNPKKCEADVTTRANAALNEATDAEMTIPDKSLGKLLEELEKDENKDTKK